MPSLCCLLTPGLNKDIRCHVWPYYFLCLQITKSDIGPQAKWALSRPIAEGHFNLPQGFGGYVWVNTLTLSPKRVCAKRWNGIRRDMRWCKRWYEMGIYITTLFLKDLHGGKALYHLVSRLSVIASISWLQQKQQQMQNGTCLICYTQEIIHLHCYFIYHGRYF